MGLWDWLNPTPDPAPSIAPAPTSDTIAEALAASTAMAQDAPSCVRARVERIVSVVEGAVPRLGASGLSDVDAYTLVATATDYLPESLSAYLSLPRDWADTRPVADGKSSLMLLVDQLDLLAASLTRMSDAAIRADATALVAQGAFLDQKFGRHTAPAVLADPAPVASTNPLDLGVA